MPNNPNDKKKETTEVLGALPNIDLDESATTEEIELNKELLDKEPSPPEGKSATTETNQPRKQIPIKKPVIPQPIDRDETIIKIEKIMQDGLNDAYQRLSPVARQDFKIKGEETALKIRDLMRATRVKAKKILNLILDWLKLLPGINHFFIIQEAKIKTDKIIALKNK